MSQSVKAIPDSYLGGIPYLCIKGADEAIELYKKLFGATEDRRFMGSNGKVFHASLTIGKATIMLTEENLEWNNKSPKTLGGSSTTVVLYFEDVDAIAAKAAAAGCNLTMPAADMFWGDRSACFVDPFGHNWMVSKHIEDVSDEEMGKRAAAMGC